MTQIENNLLISEWNRVWSEYIKEQTVFLLISLNKELLSFLLDSKLESSRLDEDFSSKAIEYTLNNGKLSSIMTKREGAFQFAYCLPNFKKNQDEIIAINNLFNNFPIENFYNQYLHKDNPDFTRLIGYFKEEFVNITAYWYDDISRRIYLENEEYIFIHKQNVERLAKSILMNLYWDTLDQFYATEKVKIGSVLNEFEISKQTIMDTCDILDGEFVSGNQLYSVLYEAIDENKKVEEMFKKTSIEEIMQNNHYEFLGYYNEFNVYKKYNR